MKIWLAGEEMANWKLKSGNQREAKIGEGWRKMAMAAAIEIETWLGMALANWHWN